jgi:peptidoglycan/xylan/chitin deacetylase (PgdA/CDA1 family)
LLCCDEPVRLRAGLLVMMVLSIVVGGCAAGGAHHARGVRASVTTTSHTPMTLGTEPNVPPARRSTTRSYPAGPLARVVFAIHTPDPVVFVTIDDGFVRDPHVLAFIAREHWPISTFIIDQVAQHAPGYFKLLRAAGATINDHTYSHPDLPTLDYAAQQQQICGPVHDFPNVLAVRPGLFRAPYGAYNDATRRAAIACGFCTMIEWTATMSDGVLKVAVRRSLHHGDIILLHFTPHLSSDLYLLAQRLAALHLHVGRLENYLSCPSH